MTATPTLESPQSNRGAWLALIAALLGWMFDGAEMGVFSLVGRPALLELLGPQHEAERQQLVDKHGSPEAFEQLQSKQSAEVPKWLGVITAIFLVGAATGGVLFGWLGDRIGRVRAMTISVLCYAVFTAGGGFAQSPWQLGLARFIASLGMGGEWSLGVALVMEVWPNRSRAFMAGLIGAAANVGYLMVGFVGLVLVSTVSRPGEPLSLGFELPAWANQLTANSGWRLMMVLGIVPALLTFFIRIFVPESRKWEEEQQRGTTSNWVTADLFGVLLGALGPGVLVYLYAAPRTYGIEHTLTLRLVATLFGVLIAVIGYTFPVLRYLQRLRASDPRAAHAGPIIRRMLLAACLSGVALLGTWGCTQQAPAWADSMTEKVHHAKEHVLIWLSVGAIVGTIAAAFLGDLVGRRKAYFVLCVLSFGSVSLLFQYNFVGRSFNWTLPLFAFIGGTCTASFYGWLPLYLPELFTTNIRATGQGFGFNFGRILAAVGSFQLGALTGYFSESIQLGPLHLEKGYPIACTVLSLVYVFGMVLIWFAPETRGRPLPE